MEMLDRILLNFICRASSSQGVNGRAELAHVSDKAVTSKPLSRAYVVR